MVNALCRIRTYNQRIMLTRYGFRRAPLALQQSEFVVWTFSSLYASAIKSLHLPRLKRRGLARDYRLAFAT